MRSTSVSTVVLVLNNYRTTTGSFLALQVFPGTIVLPVGLPCLESV